MRAFSILQSTAAVITAPIIAWALHTLIGDVLALLELRSADWRFVVTSFYGYLFLGFVCSGIAAKLAPRRSLAFYGLTVLGAILGGVFLVSISNYSIAAEAAMIVAIVVGAVAYALRMRGFSEPVYSG